MRPTGEMHLGNLVGALENWKALQDDYDCFYMVADWHALMSEYQDPKAIRATITDNVCDWISCGIDPKKSTIFVQSDVKEHLELFAVFAIITPLAWAERCPTFKEQIRELSSREINTYGFLGYPILQAADICIYKADTVPVGEDQLPHLELTREIVRRFNFLYGHTFPEPQAKLTRFPRLLGLDNKKMSKSYKNYIALSDPPDVVRRKVMDMFTDPARKRRTDPGHPYECNVYEYRKIFGSTDMDRLAYECQNAFIGCTDDKEALAEEIIAKLKPIQAKRAELLQVPKMIESILLEGAEKARAIAQETMREVRKKIGLVAR